jgi:hypothetical protein
MIPVHQLKPATEFGTPSHGANVCTLFLWRSLGKGLQFRGTIRAVLSTMDWNAFSQNFRKTIKNKIGLECSRAEYGTNKHHLQTSTGYPLPS